MEEASNEVLPSEIRQELKAHGRETIYLSVIDREGNVVSLIQSNYEGYGTGMVPSMAGFSLHNRGAGFDMEPGKPNSLAGRKRPLHTIIPAFMRNADVTVGFGIMGGWNQSQAHAQFVANVVDFGMNIQLALESARFTKSTFDGRDVQVESRVPEAVREELARRGHAIESLGAFSAVVGNGEAVMRDAKKGVNFGASDPRTDGAAIPEQPFVPAVTV
jgi:gamma-glutamyltranspeptidase/glutathione hydrolase